MQYQYYRLYVRYLPSAVVHCDEWFVIVRSLKFQRRTHMTALVDKPPSLSLISDNIHVNPATVQQVAGGGVTGRRRRRHRRRTIIIIIYYVLLYHHCWTTYFSH